MSNSQRTTKQNRLRIDTIVNSIRKGDYDDRIAEISDAIAERRRVKQEEVLALVHEVYGPDATVEISKSYEPSLYTPGNIESHIPEEPEGKETVQDALGEEVVPEGPDEKGFESRSPVIGPVNPT